MDNPYDDMIKYIDTCIDAVEAIVDEMNIAQRERVCSIADKLRQSDKCDVSSFVDEVSIHVSNIMLENPCIELNDLLHVVYLKMSEKYRTIWEMSIDTFQSIFEPQIKTLHRALHKEEEG